MIFGQTFELHDFVKVSALLVLEALLSADNALILAVIVRHLPKSQQRKALMYGLAGAFVLRLLAIVGAAIILGFWWLQLIGALYLIYLPVKHFVKPSGAYKSAGAFAASFWMTVVYADLADLVFAIDSVLVAVAVVNAREKLWVIFTGAMLGIVLLRFAAGWCLRFLDRYPVLDHVAYALVGWAGLKMMFVSGHTFVLWWNAGHPASPIPWNFPEMHAGIFWSGMALIAVGGTLLAISRSAQARELEADEAEIIEAIEAAERELPLMRRPSSAAPPRK